MRRIHVHKGRLLCTCYDSVIKCQTEKRKYRRVRYRTKVFYMWLTINNLFYLYLFLCFVIFITHNNIQNIAYNY